MAGTQLAATNHNGKGLFIPAGLINHPLTAGFVGSSPSGTMSLSVRVSGVSTSIPDIITIAIGTPKSPRALRA